MEQETVDLILQLLTALSIGRHESWEKLYALEKTLQRHPELNLDYQKELHAVQESRAAEVNRESSQRAIDNLRAKLLRG